jgi:hypothetical protein
VLPWEKDWSDRTDCHAARMGAGHRIVSAEPQRQTPAAELLPLVYEELRRLAAAKMAREPSGDTFQATALVHEAWLRLNGNGSPCFENRTHFFGAAAEAMRRISSIAPAKDSLPNAAEAANNSTSTEFKSPRRRGTTVPYWPWTKRWKSWPPSIRPKPNW